MGAAPEWEALSDVERTCLRVAFARWHGSRVCAWPDGRPWYGDSLGERLVAGIPHHLRAEMAGWTLQEYGALVPFLAARTAELDAQVAAALAASADAGVGPSGQGIRQLVLLGAGMDTRAWRLSWPPGFSVLEVDSQAVLDFKARLLTGGGGGGADDSRAAAGAEQQQHALPALACDRRLAVAADASQPEELWARLLAAGLEGSQPALFLLEGFIGYLTREAGNRLLSLLAQRSAPGSRIIMTAPPRGQEHAPLLPASQPAAASAQQAGAGSGAGAGTQSGAGSAAGAETASAAQFVARPMLHHSTFEEPTETLDRLAASGWSACRLLPAEDMAARYGIPHGQPLLLGALAAPADAHG